jgi:hypothetical protein
MEPFAKFHIIRYEPDPRRGERVNVGLLVINEGKPHVFMGRTVAKAQALSPQIVLSDVHAELQDQFEDLVTSRDGHARDLADLQIGPFTLSSPGMMVLRNRSLEEAATAAIKRLVDAPRRASMREGRTRLHTEIKDRFRKAGKLGNSIDEVSHHKVVAGFELPGDEELVADFAYLNGAWHLTQVVDYRTTAKAAASKIKEVSIKGVTLDQAKRYTERLLGDKKEVLPYAAVWVPDELERLVEPQLEVLNSYCRKLYRFNKPKEAEAYYSLMADVMEGSSQIA